MGRKRALKQGNQTDFFDSESGRILASLGVPDCGTSNHQAEIDFIREVFPAQSRDDITLVLQSCDYDVGKAIACFEDDEANDILKEWNTQGKKSKNGRKHRVKQPEDGEPCCDEAQVEKNDMKMSPNGFEDSTGTSKDDQKESMPASAIALDIPTSSEEALHSPSPSSSEVSLPSSNTSQPLNDVSDLELATKNLPSSPAQNSPTHLKYERMLSTGPDALKKTIKDLARSSVSLPRFQLLLEEECDESFKTITETFKALKQCLTDRESQLLVQLKEFKKQAVELLEKRQENAAALKLKSDRVGGMTEPEVAQLRNEIKNFVTERKIDEELAKTTRFVADKEQLLTTIKNFGRVAPIKSCYSPVTLNPPPLPSKKAEMKPNSKKEQEEVKAVDSSVPENTAVLPIALPTTDNPVNGVSAHKVLQEVAELHAKLQASLVQQGLSSAGNSQGQKQSRSDNKTNKPNSAALTHSQQHRQSQRPQTTGAQGQLKREPILKNENRAKRQSEEPRGQHQGKSYQYGGNSRRGNQRQPRNNRYETSKGKKEVPKGEDPKQIDDKISQNDNDNGQLKQPESNHKVFSQSDNTNEQVRDSRGERNRSRNRRGGRQGAYESVNGRGPSKEPEERINHGAQDKSLSQEIHVGKGPLGEEKKTETREGNNSQVNASSVSENKDSASVVKDKKEHNSISQPQNVAINGMDPHSASNLTEPSGVKTHNGESTVKKALPQRQDRGSRRRGAQRHLKDGPNSSPPPNENLNGTMPVENGVGHFSKEEKNGVEKMVQDAPHKKSPKKESKINSYVAKENGKDFDKAKNTSGMNGHAHVKDGEDSVRR